MTYAALPVMAFTHLQPAEPTTLGYRLAGYAQDLLADYRTLVRVRRGIKRQGVQRRGGQRRLLRDAVRTGRPAPL